MTRIRLRVLGLGVLLFALLGGLTAYFSSQKIPACLVDNAPRWRRPADNRLHRYEYVLPDRAICVFDMDERQKLIGATKLPPAGGIRSVVASPARHMLLIGYGTGSTLAFDLLANRIVPAGRSTIDATSATRPPFAIDGGKGVVYTTAPGSLGFRASSLETGRILYSESFHRFTWNPQEFGPSAPSHGISLSPDGRELWVMDAPNSYVHVFDVSGVPASPPRQVADILLSQPMTGDELPCSSDCARLGSIQHSLDGRFVYVGDSGDVIDARARATLTNLPALRNSRQQLEIDWAGGRPVATSARSAAEPGR